MRREEEPRQQQPRAPARATLSPPHSRTPAYLPALNHTRHNHGSPSPDRRSQRLLLLQYISLRQRTARGCGFRLATVLLLVVAPPCSSHPSRGISAFRSVERWPAMTSPGRTWHDNGICLGRDGNPFFAWRGDGIVSRGSEVYVRPRKNDGAPCC